MAEWSKAVRSGRTLFVGMGSNPIRCMSFRISPDSSVFPNILSHCQCEMNWSFSRHWSPLLGISDDVAVGSSSEVAVVKNRWKTTHRRFLFGIIDQLTVRLTNASIIGVPASMNVESAIELPGSPRKKKDYGKSTVGSSHDVLRGSQTQFTG